MSFTWSWSWPQLDVVMRVGAATARIFEASRQRWYQRERGGQLFADISDPNGLNLIVSPPHASDGSGHTWLEFNERRCQNEIEEANAKGFRLIGYWHTHPQRIPQMSPRDLASFNEFALRNKEGLPNPIAVIVGTARVPQGIRAWSVRPEGLLEGIYQVSR
jgi:hypothetical protein